MIVEYIPMILNFYNIPDFKYNNCPTRSQAIKELEEKNQNNTIDENGYFKIYPGYLYDTENELFAGDKIFGLYIKDGKTNCCLYEWKENNNPKEIVSYAMLNKWQVTETIDDLQIIEPAKESDKKRLLLTIK